MSTPPNEGPNPTPDAPPQDDVFILGAHWRVQFGGGLTAEIWRTRADAVRHLRALLAGSAKPHYARGFAPPGAGDSRRRKRRRQK